MTRRRMIAPQFWKDPDIIRLQPLDRLLVLAMISLADDWGNTLADEYVLKIEVFGIDSITPEEVAEMRDRIFEHCRNFERYEVNGQIYVHIANWTKHQTLRYRAKPVWPLAPGQIVDDTPRDDDENDNPAQKLHEDDKSRAEVARSFANTPSNSGPSKDKQRQVKQRKAKKSKGSMHACMLLPTENDKSPPPAAAALQKELEQYGIRGQKLAALLGDTWITPERVAACQRAVSERESVRNPVGLLVAMLEAHDEPSVPKPKPEDDPYRYITGKYGQYIQH